jgi:flagellin-like protein
MDLKKFFNNNKAVSPVIGVVLMVAITVILAAAIGSSVFGQGPSESAPQANIDIIVVNSTAIKLEHLGGDTVILDPDSTQIMFARGDESFELDMSAFYIEPTSNTTAATYATLDVGVTKALGLYKADEVVDGVTEANEVEMEPGEFATVKIVDVKTKQLIADKELRF